MKTYDLALVPGNDTRLNIDYKFFLVLADGGFTFDVSLFKGSGFQKCEGVSAGFGIRLSAETRGKEFLFSSANAQNIKVFVGDDEAIYQRLSGTVTINGGTLAAVTAITNSVKTEAQAQTFGASYKSSTLLAANTPDTIVSPAANVNGIELIQAFSTQQSTSFGSSFVAKASSPANVNDGSVMASGSDTAIISGALCEGVNLQRTLFIPAGLGLYFISTAAQSAAHRSALYKLL